MKKFLLKLSIYLSCLLGVVLGTNMLYLNVIGIGEPEIKNVPDNIQICNFGSSHGLMGFNYVDIEQEYTCFNFGLTSQTLRYDYKILKHYKNKIQKGAAVFIVVSYFSFFGRPEVEGKDFASRNKRYYMFLPPNLIDNYDIKTDICIKYLPVLNLHLDDAYRFMREVSRKKKVAPVRPVVNYIPKTNPDHAAQDAIEAYGRHIVSGRGGKGNKRIYRQEAFDAFYEMIAICKEIKAIPILVTTPFLKEYTDTVRQKDPEFIGDFYSVLNEIVKNTGIKYYDYSLDEHFSDAYDLFSNSDHLNSEGARIFTDCLVHEALGIDVN